jgi:hypothetical protein
MDSIQKFDALKHIKLGINEVFYYNYDGDPLPLRPISSYELDDCFHNALRYATKKVFDMVVKTRLQLIQRTENVEILDPEDYYSLQKYYDSISYWILYHSMKDFQNKDFINPIVHEGEIIPQGIVYIRHMNYVHEIANIVLDSSYKPKEMIKEIISDENGKEVAYTVFYLNVPLAQYPDLTKLQRDYLLYSKGQLLGSFNASDVRNKHKKQNYIISGQKMTMAEIIKRFYGRDVLENIQDKLDKTGEAQTPFGHIKIPQIKKKIEEIDNADS